MSSDLSISDFPAFFRALNNQHDPFPWQIRLAEMACSGEWPRSLDLPTATGKTSCLDIALFGMALRGCGPRRVFFIIDRRVVVDQAYEHMVEIAERLKNPNEEILERVAARLRAMGGADSEPVTAYQMRGGIYRDDSWIRSPKQPMLIASTVDQAGSRLLFRGYGVSDKLWPVHAGLTGNDSLLLLDEAHCSRAFAQTLARIENYRGPQWSRQNIGAPFVFVEMTATPLRESAGRFQLNRDDYEHPVLRKRLFAPKPARLILTKARPKDHGKLAEALVKEALEISRDQRLGRIAVMVNRVRTARMAHALLEAADCRTHLLIGRMRPIDRATLPPEIDAMHSGKPRKSADGPVFVVATQCLEVGADLDFDAIVTECASIDALLQRFGRLDRAGDLDSAGLTAEARILAASSTTEDKYVDPVYKRALSKTWRWLASLGEVVEFGVCSESGDRTVRERLSVLDTAHELRREAAPAPVLLPAHLDALVQTSPRPALEPDPQVFLHGKEKNSPEVQVIWRADLDPGSVKLWAEIVALCPPVTAEAMPVPLAAFREWLAGESEESAAGSDVEGGDVEAEEETGRRKKPREIVRPVLRWRGDQSNWFDPNEPEGGGLKSVSDIAPGDTLILSEATGGWNELGHIPGGDVDAAERARDSLGRGWILRLLPALIERWPDNEHRAALIASASNPSPERNELATSLRTYSSGLPPDFWLREFLEKAPEEPVAELYPSGDGRHAGWVLSARYAEADFGQDEGSAAEPVRLDRHMKDVAKEVEEIASGLIPETRLQGTLKEAAELHDCGKADLRFQALLRGGDPMAARLAPVLLAKGRQSRPSRQVRQAQWRRSGLPDGFRHELISLSLVRKHKGQSTDELLLHLIASHHGRCRPFAPVVGEPSEVSWNGWTVTPAEAAELAAHRIDSGVGERFWSLTREYGWWGLAYLETLLRLGDWKASTKEAQIERDSVAGA